VCTSSFFRRGGRGPGLEEAVMTADTTAGEGACRPREWGGVRLKALFTVMERHCRC